ncbi:MAG: ABC transporter permease [Pseudomonadales bacterium]|nr:ABC transporter permease [Pseudomonadales bacterium]
MFRNYLIAALNNLRQNKLISMINIVGLAVGLSACILIILYVQHETSYDRHWQDTDRIFRLNTTFDLPGREPYRLSQGSALLAPALQGYFQDEIELAARARPLEMEVVNGGGVLKGSDLLPGIVRQRPSTRISC